MAPREKRADAVDRANRLSAENTQLSQILSDVVNGVKPDAEETIVFREITIRLRLYRSRGAMAGLLLETMGNHSTVIPLDTYRAHYGQNFDAETHPLRDALDRITAARNALLAEGRGLQ